MDYRHRYIYHVIQEMLHSAGKQILVDLKRAPSFRLFHDLLGFLAIFSESTPISKA